MAQWFLMKGRQKVGPVDTPGLKRLVQLGQLLPTDIIWREGLPGWVPASQAKGLFESEDPASVTSAHPQDGSVAASDVPTREGPSVLQNRTSLPSGSSVATTKVCPYCAEPIAFAAIKCKHCGEFLSPIPMAEPTDDEAPSDPSFQELGDGRFALHGSYEWGFEIVGKAMRDCKVSVKEADPTRGIVKGKCPYGINAFGMTVTAAFHSSGQETILELSAAFTDAFDTFGACNKKTRQISDRLIEIAGPRSTPGRRSPAEARNRNSPHSLAAPDFAHRSGPSSKGKAITGFCMCLGGLFFGPAAIVGLVMCGIALTNMSTSNNQEGTGIAIAGLVIGFLAILVWFLLLLYL